MNEYLIALQYHYPENYELWEKGITEDYEASTGLFVLAPSLEDALEWAAVVATELLNHVNKREDLTMSDFQHQCWLIPEPENSAWAHCLSFFQRVKVGEMPNVSLMTVQAYKKWQMANEKKNKNI